MVRNLIPVSAFLILLLLTFGFPPDLATSTGPGWHTTVFPPFLSYAVILIITLLFGITGCWLLSHQVTRLTWILFAAHFFLTVPAAILINFPAIFLNVHPSDKADLFRSLQSRVKIIHVARVVSGGAQVLFLIYFVRTVYLKRLTNNDRSF